MPFINYSATNFPHTAAAHLHGNQLLGFAWSDLLWAAITVGKPGYSYLFAHGWHSVSDIIVRLHSVYANLRLMKNEIEKSTLYVAQDPTEKGATSYFIGMIMAKLFADRLLGTPWLFHFSMTGPLGMPVRMRGTLEPDLFGLRSDGSWIVAEAKGRSNRFSADALAKAKLQTKAVRRVCGKKPALQVAIQSYFTPQLAVHLDDPESEDGEGHDIDIDVNAAARRYYSFAYEATAGSVDVRELGGRHYAFRNIADTGVSIGLDVNLRTRLGGKGLTESQLPESLFPVTPSSDEHGPVYSDGIAILVDQRWSDERMAVDPNKRPLI
jgi:hypothetical protein